jgi:hypothetical protein
VRSIETGLVMVRLLLILSVLFSALPAAAGEAPSVVVIEGISLPDHLDAFHARARDAIVSALERAGWRPVADGSSPCRDAGCAVEVARGSGAAFVLIADGKYRTGGYDLRVQLWNGREMLTDQASCEDCTGPEFVSRLEGMVTPLVENQKKRVALAAAPPPPPAAPLVTATPAPLDGSRGRAYLAPLGWAALVGGAAAAAAGGYLLWADGRLENCVDTSAGTRNCSREHVTHGGLPLVIGGAGLATIGGVLLIYRQVTAPAELSLHAGPASVALSGSF